ncbi:MAG: squalene/phytoene synthase family protein [Magnetococcales bacterium]|nr:squalene/phytoene synthase family protein [Magnetococcales bacterium]
MDRRPLDRCLEIAARNRSPLFQVSRLFSREKGGLFLACYAAMRLVDDLVDERFLVERQGEESRAAVVREQVERWRAQACAAARGDFQAVADSYEPLVFEALNQTAGRSELGEWPWNALALSMMADIAKNTLVTWNDFLTYAEGATVAPATVFVYILSCRHHNDRFTTPWPVAHYRELVREMAVFCYVIHILRDLERDVGRSGQLVTIPEELLRAAGLDKSLLARWVIDEPYRILPLRRLLLEKAAGCRQRGLERLVGGVDLPALERQILKKLLGHYLALFEEMRVETEEKSYP